MLEIIAILSVMDVQSPDQVFEAELQVIATASTAAAANQAFFVHFADLGVNWNFIFCNFFSIFFPVCLRWSEIMNNYSILN